MQSTYMSKSLHIICYFTRFIHKSHLATHYLYWRQVVYTGRKCYGSIHNIRSKNLLIVYQQLINRLLLGYRPVILRYTFLFRVKRSFDVFFLNIIFKYLFLKNTTLSSPKSTILLLVGFWNFCNQSINQSQVVITMSSGNLQVIMFICWLSLLSIGNQQIVNKLLKWNLFIESTKKKFVRPSR